MVMVDDGSRIVDDGGDDDGDGGELGIGSGGV